MGSAAGAARTRKAARGWPVLCLLVTLLAAGAARAEEPWNFVVFITDDQRFDTLWAMPILQDRLVSRGVVFENAYVTIPSCCPSRASFLAGGFHARNTQVLANDLPNGGWPRFVEADSLPVRLQREGYRTFLVGKYMNNHLAPQIPPGWTEFAKRSSGDQLLLGSTGPDAPGVGVLVDAAGFMTDVLRDKALELIDEHAGQAPLFLWFSTLHPHWPARPKVEDADLFSDYVYRGRGYVAGSFSNKVNSVEEEDEFHRDQLRSLQAVDRAIGAIYDRLEQLGEIDRTVFFFTSDHGYMWGEHGLFAKDKPREESVRVPFVMVRPGVTTGTSDPRLIAANLDLPATILTLANVLPRPTDGRDLDRLARNPSLHGREHVFLEHYDGPWAGVRTRGLDGTEWKYAEVGEDGKDNLLFDLINDPYELVNLMDDPAYADVKAELAALVAQERSLTITYGKTNAPSARLGEPYEFVIPTWGGAPPLQWSLLSGTLPEGLSLDTASGTVAGVPTRGIHDAEVWIEVVDASIADQAGVPRSHAARLRFTVRNDDDGDGIHELEDNCPAVYNPGQEDADGDGIGDACDPPCRDGLDNDGDGDVDYPDDPGCRDSLGLENPQCDDGIDNDGDGKTDYPADGNCAHAWSPQEQQLGNCGLGIELTLLLPALAWLRRRRRLALLVAVPVSAALLGAGPAEAGTKDPDVPFYVVGHLTDNGANDQMPRTAQHDYVIWVGRYNLPGATSVGGDYEVMLWDGETIVQLTDNGVDEDRPVVNNLGEAAWQWNGTDELAEIMAYTGGQILQITADVPPVRDRYPDINDAGVITWGRWVAALGQHSFASYDLRTSNLVFLPAVSSYRPKINNNGNIVVKAFWFRDKDGNVVQDLPEAGDFGPYSSVRRSSINDLDHLFLEMDTSFPPASGDKDGPRDIVVWDGVNTTLIHSSAEWAGRGEINTAGAVVWEGYGGLPGSSSATTDREIFVYDPAIGQVVQLTDDEEDDLWPSILDDGTVVWQSKGVYPGAQGRDSDSEIFLAYRDLDQDGVADVGDNCPAAANPDQEDLDEDGAGDACETECKDGIDNDGDGDVDLRDANCFSSDDPLESSLPGACGLGAELALGLPLGALLRRRRRP